jgi:antirestriction protein ArdC
MAKTEKKNVYEIVTERIVAKLEEGTVPWRKPWITYDDGLGARNLVYKKPYRGINAFLTSMMPFESPFYLTDRQVAKNDDWSIKEDEKGKYLPVIYWNWRTKEELDEAKAKGTPIAPFFTRYSRVYNTEQLEGVEVPKVKPLELNKTERMKRCEKVLAEMPNKPEINEVKSNRAFYCPPKDNIQIPLLGQFEKAEEYYSTLFHELIHATGHDTRVHRKDVMKNSMFGSADYSKEELIAECGAAFLCSKTGIDNTLDNSAAYIKGWLSKLKNNPKLVIEAAQAAQKGADYVLGEYKDYSKKTKASNSKKLAA